MDCTFWEVYSQFVDLLSNVVYCGTDYTVLGCLSRTLVCSLLVFTVTTFLWRQYYQRAWDPASKLPLPPGCMGYPIVGESLAFIFQGSDYYLSRRQQYGHVYKTHLLGRPTVRVIGAHNIRSVLMGEHTLVASSWPKSVQLLFGPGSLANSSPGTHRMRKKVFQDILSPAVVARHLPMVQRIVRSHIRGWCDHGETSGMDVCKKLFFALTVDVVLGFQLHGKDRETTIAALNVFLVNLFSLPWNIPGSGLWKGLKARETLIRKIKTILGTESTYGSIADDLKETNQATFSQTPEDLADAILELWFASNDTLASSACSMLLAVGRDARVLDAVETELARHGLLEGDAELTNDSLRGLTYVGHVIREVLRIYPPVGGGFRKATKTLEIGGYQIPKGWKVIYSIRDTHQTSQLFPQREEFLPERWNKMDQEGNKHDQRFNYVPFGAGARACPGSKFAHLVLQTFIVELVRTCTWKLKDCNPKMKYLPITHPSDGLPVTFTFR